MSAGAPFEVVVAGPNLRAVDLVTDSRRYAEERQADINGSERTWAGGYSAAVTSREDRR